MRKTLPGQGRDIVVTGLAQEVLDLLLADAHGLAGWAGMAGQVVSGASEIGGLQRAQARAVVLEADEPIPYQIDGDTLGSCRRLEASVVPGALTVMLPR